ncbi:Uncharacterised protein [Segatella copri]|nr:Uncharacterised protein [Segatella copri]
MRPVGRHRCRNFRTRYGLGSISETFFLTLDTQSGNHYIIQFYRIVAELRLLYFFTIYRTFLFNSLAAILCNLTIHASCCTA